MKRIISLQSPFHRSPFHCSLQLRPFIAFVLIVTALLMAGLIAGCSSSNSNNLPTDFSGEWEASYNIVLDECGLLPEEATAFDDTHQISQNGQDITLLSDVLAPDPYTGTLRTSTLQTPVNQTSEVAPSDEPYNSFLVTSSLSGNLFGDGIDCEFTEALSYNNSTQPQATTLYTAKITCADGFTCNTTARGTTTKAT